MVEGDRVASRWCWCAWTIAMPACNCCKGPNCARPGGAIAAELLRHEGESRALPRERQLLALTRGEVARLQDLVTKKVGAQSPTRHGPSGGGKAGDRTVGTPAGGRRAPSRLADVEGHVRVRRRCAIRPILEVDRCEVRRAFNNGRIIEVLVSPGRRVRVGDPLVALFDTDAWSACTAAGTPSSGGSRRASAGEPLVVHGEIDGSRSAANWVARRREASAAPAGRWTVHRHDRCADEVSQGRFVRLELALPETDGLIALPHEATVWHRQDLHD